MLPDRLPVSFRNSRRKTCFFLSVLLLLTSLFSCAPAKAASDEVGQNTALLLAEGAESAYRVIVSEQASEDILKIADEFVHYVSAVTGVNLSVERGSSPAGGKEILIGKTNRVSDNFDYETSGEDTFCYKACGETLLLTGQNERGVAYAVYAFFEDVCGVRYYTPD